MLASLAASGRLLVDISLEAMQCFAVNVLEVRATDAGRCERRVLVMSGRAAAALQAEPGHWSSLRGSVDEVLAVDINAIEAAGGGSVRCMLAEIFAT